MLEQQPAAHGHVVVGFDGSPGAVAAAKWGVFEAALRGVALHVVYVWQYPGLAFPDQDPRLPGPDVLPIQLEGSLTAALADCPRILIRRHTVEGAPAESLIQASATADLLVVGRRRHSLNGLALGSVSRRCAAHARCPVVTVPPPDAG
jgi:nucleotide-binding universal stress UspA family protein